MLVVGIMGIVGSMAVLQIGRARSGFRGDGAMRVVIAQLNIAREQSITERRNIAVSFTENNEVLLMRREVPEGETPLGLIPLEGGVQFAVVDPLPDTPESFGNSTPIDFGTAAATLFTTDGSLVNEIGQPVNGTVFLAVPGDPLSARAVTVLGSTGRIRSYKWDGARWVRG